MTRPVDRLIAAGRWLYGPTNNWMKLLAKNLDVDPETLRKWVTGKREYPWVHYDDKVVDLLDLHRHEGDTIRLSFFQSDENVFPLASSKNSPQL